MSGAILLPAVRNASFIDGGFALSWEETKRVTEELLLAVPDVKPGDIVRVFYDNSEIKVLLIELRVYFRVPK